MINLKGFINQKGFEDIDKKLNRVKEEKKNNHFNLFSISSTTSHIENFHSDVITLLLNPKERHKQSNLFLHLLIDYLNTFGFQIDKQNFNHSEVTRETGRIDVWIRDTISKQSIIIENKINNAGDMEDQLERYYNYAINNGFDVVCAVYLTLQGNKNAPITNNYVLNEKITNISAFTNKQDDLFNGWIFPCYIASKNNEDCSSFIYQYGKLLKHLSTMGLDRKIKDEFYDIVSQENGLNKIGLI